MLVSCTATAKEGGRPNRTNFGVKVCSHKKVSYTWAGASSSNAYAEVNQEIDFSQSAASKIRLPLRKLETKYFIVFTNVPTDQPIDFLPMLDMMYANVMELLNMPAEYNIWKGKAAVYLFNTREQFINFEKNMYGNTITFQAAICHQHYTGEVRIATYNMKDKLYLQQLMVHEAAHGIIHRYKSPKRIPVWLNEGLADWAAMSTQADLKNYRVKKTLSVKFIKNKGYLPKAFFGKLNFIPEYYGSALAITDMLISKGKDKFIRFIDQIKSGSTWQDAMFAIYQLTPAKLITVYGESINIPALTIKAD